MLNRSRNTPSRRRGGLELDLSSYSSVKYFCARVAKLDGGDAVILKAGLATRIFEIFEGDENCVTVNVISKIFLALLLIHTLHASTAKWNTVPTLMITCSDIYSRAKFLERYAPDSLQVLCDQKYNYDAPGV